MSYALSVHQSCSSYAGLPTFSTRVIKLKNEEEFTRVHQLCKDQTNMAGLLKGVVMVIRTDDNASLFEDLVMPTLMHAVIKVDQVVMAPFVVLAFAFDILTLPIRLLTLIPRIYYNSHVKSVEHPLLAFFREKGLDKEHPNFFHVKGTPSERLLVPTQRIQACLFKEEIQEGKLVQKGTRYELYLSYDREEPFASKTHDFFRTVENNDTPKT